MAPYSVRALPFFLAAAVLTVSCQSPKGTERGRMDVPAAWRNADVFPAAAPERDLAVWWTKFNDPVLTRVIRGALAGSPDLASAATRVRAARAQRKAQAASLFPSVNASGDRSLRSDLSRGADEGTDTSYSAGLDLSWEVDLFGKTRLATRAAAANAEAAREDWLSAQASLASETALAYIDLRSAEARLAVVAESVRTRGDTVQIAGWRAKAGEIDTLELRQAESSLEQAKASLSSLKQTISQTRNRLALLSGLAPGALDSVLTVKSPKVPEPAKSMAVGIPADTLEQRPDVRAAGWQWLAAVARTSSAKRERLPRLSLSGSLGIDTLSSGKLFNPETAAASLLAGLSAPLFDAGRIRAGIEERTAAQDEAWESLRSSVLTALSEVEDALIACQRSDERHATLERAAKAARDASRLANLSYKSGDTDILTVLEAQRTLLSVEDSLISARSDRAAARVRLYKALGGGWSDA